MDACWMAAQLLVNCITKETNLAPFTPPAENQPLASMVPSLLRSSSPHLSRAPAKIAGNNLTPELSPPAIGHLSFGLDSAQDEISISRDAEASPLNPGNMGSLSAQVEVDLQALIATHPSPHGRFANQGQVQTDWSSTPRPVNGSQMYRFRLASLRAGKLYTRISPLLYQYDWQSAPLHPTHQDWQALLRQEAAVMARAQGHNRLSIVLGDSLSLWLPAELLPRNHFWLNQGIAGETTSQILERLQDFSQTRPHTIHLMAGINDLKQGASDDQVLRNFQRILYHLKRQHPQSRIVVYSILPTRWQALPSDRISALNRSLAYLASYEGASFVDLQPAFRDGQGQLRQELTTDGIHLAPEGYELWRTALVSY